MALLQLVALEPLVPVDLVDLVYHLTLLELQ